MGATDISVLPQMPVLLETTTFQADTATSIPLRVKAAPSQSANLFEAVSNSGTVLAKINAFGDIQGKFLHAFGGGKVEPVSSSGIGLFIRGRASQTGNLMEFQNSAGTIMTFVGSNGIISDPGFASYVLNPSTGANATRAQFTPSLAANKGLVIKGVASQTGNLLEFQNSASTVLANVQSDGRFNDNGHIRAMSLANFVVVQPGQNGAGFLPPRWDGSNFSWQGRLLILGAGRGPGFANPTGHYDIVMPAAGTVIPGFGGAPSQTVGAAGVPIPIHTALYAVIDPYGGNTSSTFAMMGYTAAFVVPSNWFLVASNTENASSGKIRTAWGSIMDVWKNVTFQNGWANYGVGYNPVQFYKDTNGFVHIRGLGQGGLFASNVVFNLPVGYRPSARCLFSTMASDTTGRFDVLPDGNVLAVNGSGWMTFEGATFLAEN